MAACYMGAFNDVEHIVYVIKVNKFLEAYIAFESTSQHRHTDKFIPVKYIKYVT